MSDYLKDLIHKYIENACSTEETSILLEYLATPEGQACLAAMIDQDVAHAHRLSQDMDLLNVNQQVWRDVQQQTWRNNKSTMIKLRQWYWVAASVAGLLLMGAYWFFYVAAPTVYQTAYGETKAIMLSDSTEITLNANSTLTCQSDYDTHREVWLKGEAFFEVRHIEKNVKGSPEKEAIKFVVHANDLAVEVMGTSFNVNNRNKKTQVVLNTGKVRLKAASPDHQQQKLLSMQPGDMVEVFEDNIEIKKKVVDPMVYSSWKDNKMVCNETPLAKVAHVIRDTYGKQLMFANPALSEKEITGTLPTNNLNLLLDVLAESLQLDIQQQADTILIKEIKD